MAHKDWESLDKETLSYTELEIIFIIRQADKVWVPHWEITKDSSLDRYGCSKVLERLRRRGIVVKRQMEKGMPGQTEYSFNESIRGRT